MTFNMSTVKSYRTQLEKDLINLLELDIVDDETVDKILSDLINNGRQSLSEHQDDILEDIYREQIKDNSQLLELLKTSIIHHWSTNLFSTYSWFHSFIQEYQTKFPDLYDQIITRTAEYGRTNFVTSNDNGEQVLFIVVQCLFNLDNERLTDGYTFNRIWNTLIQMGIEGIQQLSEFIDLNQIKIYENVLRQALKEYFRPELFSILSNCQILDCRGLHEFILDEIGRFGWRLGIDSSRKKITPRMFRQFLQHLEVLAPLTTINDETKKTSKNKYLTLSDHLIDVTIWNQAGEFQSLANSVQTIVDRYCQHQTPTLFIRDCSIPIMYLLKRNENLRDFLELIHRSCYDRNLDYSQIHLRTLIHVLLSNSDEFVRRLIVKQLTKQNIVPFIQPESLNIHFDILSIWNCTCPSILSFGIGPCLGKTNFLNNFFSTQFEEHQKKNIYFQETIDLNFGQQMNLADVHGLLTKECFIRIQTVFHGYLIHIDEVFMKQYPSIFNEYLALIEFNKFRLIIVHNSKTKTPISFHRQSLVLSKTIEPNFDVYRFLFDDIKKEMNKRLKDIHFNIEQTQTNLEQLSTDYQTINSLVNNCFNKLSLDKKANENEIDFPFYVQFSNICCQRQQQRKQAFIEAKDNSRGPSPSSFNTNEQLPSLGLGFEVFLEILQLPTTRRLVVLDYLVSKSKGYLSIDIFWRNVMICFERCSSPYLQTSLINAYVDFIRAGFAFEIIDGDHFYLQQEFLTKIFMNLSENQEKKIFVLSILGPKQTGKSRLLQDMFGIRYETTTTTTRLTRGLYGTLVKSNVDNYDYILVLDVEGFDRTDDEFDRSMIFFCMSISHIVILNIINEIPGKFLDNLSVCNDSLKRLIGNRSQTCVLHLVLNQISFVHTDYSNKILKEYHQSKISTCNLKLSLDSIHIRPLFDRKDPLSTRVCTEELCAKIMRSIARISPTSFTKWLNTAIQFFDALQNTPTISFFESLLERSYDDHLFNFIRRYLIDLFTPIYREQFLERLDNKSSNEIDELFREEIKSIVKTLQTQINERLSMINLSRTIIERSQHFLQRQITETFDDWRQEIQLTRYHRSHSCVVEQNLSSNKSIKKQIEQKTKKRFFS